MTVKSSDVLELVKIIITSLLGYILVKALLSIDYPSEPIKCICNYINSSGVIRLN